MIAVGNRHQRPIKPIVSNGSEESHRPFHRQEIEGNNFSPFLSTGWAAPGGTGGSWAEPRLKHRPWEETRPSCASAREETAPGGAQSSPLKHTFLHKAPSSADWIGVVPEAGSAGCLTAGKAWGETMRAGSEGSLSTRKQMCVLLLQTCFTLRCLGSPSALGWKRRHFCCDSPLV